ncbi:MAG TPA: PQQ-dependent sugar dehydrogenase [Gammaproteobacteria bacterium]
MNFPELPAVSYDNAQDPSSPLPLIVSLRDSRVQPHRWFGWNCREGGIAYTRPGPACAAATSLVDPVHDYPRTEGQSVTGGYVYRGAAIPALAGQYVFGDFGSGRIWRLVEDGAGGLTADELASTGLRIASFAEDPDGELYIVDLEGTLHRIVPAGDDAPDESGSPVPERLSDTGCFDADGPSRFGPGVIPYDVAAPAWFDGAERERGLALPDGTAIAIDDGDRWVFPPGAVLVEHLRLDGALVETRLLMHHPGGEWRGYGYEWNADGSDARLVTGGKRVEIGDTEWVFPSGGDCVACHRAAAGTALGLETAQLNRPFTYPSTGRTANQLETLDAIGLFVSPIGDADVLPALAAPSDQDAPLDARARAYLHASCAHCHRGAGGALDLRYDTLLDRTGACDVPPERGDLGIADARLIAPGDPERSVLLARIERRDALAMPPLASTRVDADGAALVRAWIESLESCL